MSALYDDVIFKICNFLTDREKIHLTMASKKMDQMKYKFIYHEKIDVNKILGLSYFNGFKIVEILDKKIQFLNLSNTFIFLSEYRTQKFP